MKLTKKLVLMAALMGSVALPIAGANAETSSSTSSMQNFKALDKDKNGTLSAEEYGNMSGGVDFGTLDTNKDDVLTLSELQAGNANKSAPAAGSAADMGTRD